MTAMIDFAGIIKPWGNGLGVRLTKPVAQAAGVVADTPVHISVEPGRIVVELRRKRPSLKQMLAEFDPKLHGGEAMAFKPVGKEAL